MQTSTQLRKGSDNITRTQLSPDELEIHPIAQRRLVPSNVNKIVNNFDYDFVGVVHAVPNTNGGKPLVVDGHHRIVAMKKKNYSDIPVDVHIHTDVVDDAGACRLFLELNRRANVGPYPKFEAARIAGDPAAVGAFNACAVNGIEITTNASGDNKLTCVSSIQKSFELDGTGVALTQALRILKNAFGGSAGAFDGTLVWGFSLMTADFGNIIDENSFTRKLAGFTGGYAGILAYARGRRALERSTVPVCVARVAIAEYNRGRRTGRIGEISNKSTSITKFTNPGPDAGGKEV